MYLSLPLEIIVFIFGSLAVMNLGGWWGGFPPIYVGSHSFLSVAFPQISAMPEGAGLIGSHPAWCLSCTHTSNSCVGTEMFVCGSFSLAEGDLLV